MSRKNGKLVGKFVVFAPYKAGEKLWELGSEQGSVLVTLMRIPNKVKSTEVSNDTYREVCFRRPNVRAWAIRMVRSVIKELRLYDESGKVVHYYKISHNGRILDHLPHSPRINRNHKT